MADVISDSYRQTEGDRVGNQKQKIVRIMGLVVEILSGDLQGVPVAEGMEKAKAGLIQFILIARVIHTLQIKFNKTIGLITIGERAAV